MRNLAPLAALALVGVVLIAETMRDSPTAAAPVAEKRVAWTTSKITGSPEPPHPYRVVPAFPEAAVQESAAPHERARARIGCSSSSRPGKIFSFPNRPDVDKADLVIDLSKDLKSWKPGGKVQGFDALYGLTFHPKFAENRYCYVCYVLKGQGGRVARRQPRVALHGVEDRPAAGSTRRARRSCSRSWPAGTTAAASRSGRTATSTSRPATPPIPNPPDALDTGQDCSDLLSSVLRIDVDREDAGQALRGPEGQPVRRSGRRAAGDLGVRLPQPVEDELRPRDRRSVGRRRRLGTVGDGLPDSRRAATTAGRSRRARSR